MLSNVEGFEMHRRPLVSLFVLFSAVFLVAPAAEACLYCDREVQCPENVWEPCRFVWACIPVTQPPDPRAYTECTPRSSGCRMGGNACVWASSPSPQLPHSLQAPVLACSVLEMPQWMTL